MVSDIKERHGIGRGNIVGHSDVAPARKEDPGELFPWWELAKRRLALPSPSRDLMDPYWTDAGFLLAAFHRAGLDVAHGPMVQDAVRAGGEVAIHRALDNLPEAQTNNRATRSMHAAAFATAQGELKLVREDVGRHNALDKVIGQAFLAERLPLVDRILLVSGRVSFELMQKALAAGIPCVAAISAPTW